jgi:beta-lactam-binding protein with PASTA domain/tRNA A-37 threonylcarbamoyl transferase component Bud32
VNQLKTYGGRYEIFALAGQGGMAEVYRARDALLGREVAVKVLSPRLSHDRSFVERFRREAQTAAALNHPNVVSLYDFGSDNSTYFIVMEFIDGRSLSDIIATDGALLPERAAEIASDVAKGLGRAHDAGLVHRDIKPSNIMITTGGETKVTDFGIARALSSDQDATMTQTGMVIGTASYLSPEQAQGKRVDARSDVYSLGCVLFEMLTGAPPFDGDTPLSIAYKHVREPPVRPSDVNADVPNALDSIVFKAMSKNPDNRYLTATDMSEDLDRYLSGQNVAATPFLDETAIMGRGNTRVLEETAYPEPRTGRRMWPALIWTLLGLALLGGLVYLLASDFFDAPASTTVQVADVVGLEAQVARNRLERDGLAVIIERGPSGRDPGSVFAQDPRGGAEVEEGSEVTLQVSTGPALVEVPGLIGLTRDGAEQALADSDLSLGSVTRTPSDEADEGVVIDQDPGEGKKLEPGEAVNIEVSSGPETITVPNVVGQSEGTAVDILENAGFGVDSVSEPNSEVPAGTVFEQNPVGDSEASAGDTVTIVVSEGAEGAALPDLTGLFGDDAEDRLESFGLDANQEDDPVGCSGPPETVCRTDPPPGTPLQEGDEVTLFVNDKGGDD